MTMMIVAENIVYLNNYSFAQHFFQQNIDNF